MIITGRASANGQIVTESGPRVVAGQEPIAVDCERLAGDATGPVYVMLKPRGILLTAEDARGRPTVADLL